MGVEVRVYLEGLLQLFFLCGNIFGVVSGRGMLTMVPDVECVARNQMVVELLFVFDDLNAKKDSAKSERGDQEKTDELYLADLRGPDRHGHGQAAHNQHHGIEATECQV